MWIFADENVPGTVVRALGDAGQDVVWMRVADPGASDGQVVHRLAAEGRVLLTFDKQDFGPLVMGKGLPPECGVVLFRLPMSPRKELAPRVLAALAAAPGLEGRFVVVERDRIRSRSLR